MNLIDTTYQWVAVNATTIGITVSIVILYLALDRFSTPKLVEGADHGGFKEGSALKAIRIARLLTGFIGLLVMALTWGIEFDAVFVFASTTLTLLGVALFASWSLLSNVTAYFVILLNPSFRRGTFVRIIDVDNYSEGYISELSLFSTKLVTESREVIIYPNNLLLGRPTLINPRDRLHGIGKLPSHTNIDRPISQPTTS
ncbi:MAG: small-conductance mechanosensitive channel [Planctomycetaceae bacterium]|jgi:small-conductance mechanosensitive channel